MSQHNILYQFMESMVHSIVNNLEFLGAISGTILGISIANEMEMFVLKGASTIVLGALGVISGWWTKRSVIPILEKKFPKKNEHQ